MLIFGVLLVLYSVVGCAVSIYKVKFIEDDCFRTKEVTYELGTTSSATSSVILKAARHIPYHSFLSCAVHLKPNQHTSGGIILSMQKVKVQASFISCYEHFKIEESSSVSLATFCDSSANQIYQSFPNFNLEYKSNRGMIPPVRNSGIELVATAYSDMPCRSDEFPCNNSKCIWKGLKCDSLNNCGDNSDEDSSLMCSKNDTYVTEVLRSVNRSQEKIYGLTEEERRINLIIFCLLYGSAASSSVICFAAHAWRKFRKNSRAERRNNSEILLQRSPDSTRNVNSYVLHHINTVANVTSCTDTPPPSYRTVVLQDLLTMSENINDSSEIITNERMTDELHSSPTENSYPPPSYESVLIDCDKRNF